MEDLLSVSESAHQELQKLLTKRRLVTKLVAFSAEVDEVQPDMSEDVGVSQKNYLFVFLWIITVRCFSSKHV